MTSDDWYIGWTGEYTLFKDGTEIIAEWEGDHEEMIDLRVTPGEDS